MVRLKVLGSARSHGSGRLGRGRAPRVWTSLKGRSGPWGWSCRPPGPALWCGRHAGPFGRGKRRRL